MLFQLLIWDVSISLRQSGNEGLFPIIWGCLDNSHLPFCHVYFDLHFHLFPGIWASEILLRTFSHYLLFKWIIIYRFSLFLVIFATDAPFTDPIACSSSLPPVSFRCCPLLHTPMLALPLFYILQAMDEGNELPRDDWQWLHLRLLSNPRRWLHLTRNDNLRIEMHFATALEQTENVAVYGEFEGEIDRGLDIIYNHRWRPTIYHDFWHGTR